MKYDVKDLGLAKEGKNRIYWAALDMPVLKLIKKKDSRRRSRFVELGLLAVSM